MDRRRVSDLGADLRHSRIEWDGGRRGRSERARREEGRPRHASHQQFVHNSLQDFCRLRREAYDPWAQGLLPPNLTDKISQYSARQIANSR